jgi:hypothetical protein
LTFEASNLAISGKDGRDGRDGKDEVSWAGAGAAVFETGAGHALAQAVLFEKVVLQAEELLVD